MKPICFDVGANFGQELEEFLKAGFTVYAFEPVPRLIEHLKTHFKGYGGFRPVPLAVDIENRWVEFKENPTTACSSIYEFAPDVAAKWSAVAHNWNPDVLEQRVDFVTTDRYPVMTTRLDTFMATYKIDHVDYLWVDAQGNDFNVLRSLGDRIRDVKKGQVEAAYHVDLYDNEDNKATDIAAWLNQRGFNCNIVPHPHQNEADVYFERIE